MKRLLFWPAWVLAWSGGCELAERPAGQQQPNLFEQGAGDRIADGLAFDTLWTYGQGDTLLANATDIELLPGGDAIVLDAFDQRVHRIGPAGVAWSWGRRGEGPRDVQNVRAMTVGAKREVVLADSGNRRLVWLSADGEWLRATSLPRPTGAWMTGTVNGIVRLGNGGYLLQTMDDALLVPAAASGAFDDPIPVPWEAIREMDPLLTYGEIASGQDEQWVFGFGVGNGFFVFSGRELQGSYPYVEHVDFPALVRSRSSGGFRVSYSARPTRAAQDMAIRGDTLLVLARNWHLDRYRLDTGEYLESTNLPGPIRRFTLIGDTLLVIDGAGLVPAIAALVMKGGEAVE